MMPHDLPPWEAVYQQTPRWLKAGVFEAIVHDLRVVRRRAKARAGQPSAAIFDSRTRPSTPETGPRAGYDGAKCTRGSQVHMTVETLGHLLGLHVTAADEQDRAHVAQLAVQVQAGTAPRSTWPSGYTGDRPAEAATAPGRQLEVVKWSETKQGFELLPRRWVVERSIAWVARVRRLARDYERLPGTLAGFHVLAFVILLRKRFVEMMR